MALAFFCPFQICHALLETQFDYGSFAAVLLMWDMIPVTYVVFLLAPGLRSPAKYA